MYVSISGKKFAVIHDSRTGEAIIRLFDGTIAVLPPEYVGYEGRYKNKRIDLWERDSDVLLWVDGSILYSGTIEQ